ncbi:MAG: archease [Candidatus Woesearchaeota archaeon]
MVNFEFFDHTADVKFRAYGKDLEEAFSNAALATFQVMTEVSKVKDLEEKEIFVKSSSNEALLFDFIDELIFLLDTEGFLLSKVNKLSIKNGELHAIISGDNADNYDVHTYVKAPTYNEMQINKDPVWVQLVLDL